LKAHYASESDKFSKLNPVRLYLLILKNQIEIVRSIGYFYFKGATPIHQQERGQSLYSIQNRLCVTMGPLVHLWLTLDKINNSSETTPNLDDSAHAQLYNIDIRLRF
jgi:hypothetical protein